MSIERTIIQRLNESHGAADRIYESWPPVLNQIRSRPDKDRIRNALNKAGIDIENTPYQEVVITSGRDPRLKGKNLVIFEVQNKGIGVWFNGKALQDVYIYAEQKNLFQLSWAKILSYSKRITSVEFDEKLAAELKAKKDARADAKKGMEVRYTKKNKPRWAQIDKSGYVLNPNKYKDMLARMNVDNGVKILQDAKDIYVRVSQNIDKIDWDADSRGSTFESYQYVMQEIPRIFASLSRSLKAYESAKDQLEKAKKYGDSDNPAEDAEWYVRYHKESVTKDIKELKAILAKAKKYL